MELYGHIQGDKMWTIISFLLRKVDEETMNTTIGYYFL